MGGELAINGKTIKEISEIILNKKNMENMGKKALTKSVKNVQEKIYNEIKKIVKGEK